MVSFDGTLVSGGGSTTGIAVPEAVWAELTPARRAALIVTVNGYRYPLTVGFYKGAYMISVSSAIRAAAGVALGDTVPVTLELDVAPQQVEPPEQLAAVLDSVTRSAWQKLAPSAKKAMAASITDAKTDETRQRRIDKALDQLGA